MNTMKICASILIGSALIASALYMAITQNRRAFMESCIPMTTSTGIAPLMAEYLCATRFKS
jgi:hypothetical protein